VAALALLLAIPRKRKPRSPNEALQMVDALSAGIYTIKQTARRIGLVNLGNELAVHGHDILDFSPGLAGRFTDAQRAELYARRYANLWRTKFNQLQLKRVEPTKAAELATRAAETRLRSIAITEVNRSVNEQKRDVALLVQQRTRVQLYEVWDAQRDACEVCASYDGDETPVGEPFGNGESPGWVHPNCQCESHYITK
jgi:hypothetical protein